MPQAYLGCSNYTVSQWCNLKFITDEYLNVIRRLELSPVESVPVEVSHPGLKSDTGGRLIIIIKMIEAIDTDQSVALTREQK